MLLTSADLESTGDPLVAQFEWEGDVPNSGAVLWVIWVTSADGERSRHLGYKIVDGEPSAHFVFDFVTSKQVNNVGRADLAGQRLVTTFPRSAIDELGPGWKWQAALAIDGDDKSERPWVLGESPGR